MSDSILPGAGLPPANAGDFGEPLLRVLRDQGDFALALLREENVLPHCGALAVASLCLLAFHGAAMGFPQGFRQGVSSALKVPMLFLGSLLICFPALCSLGLAMGAGIDPSRALALLLFAMALNAALLASLAPIAWFFGMGSDYHFMKVMHVLAFAACGLWSMAALHKAVSAASGHAGLMNPAGLHVFQAWILVYGFVGAQMAWSLRPFIGEPGLPFELVRRRGSGLNFYAAFWLSLRRLKERQNAQESEELWPGADLAEKKRPRPVPPKPRQAEAAAP